MKERKQGIKGFLAGVLATVLLAGAVVPALAAMQEIKVSVGGIDIYVDGQLKIPVNAKGTRVEPIAYDGTTYLPIRAISNMLGKEVTWDGETSSIYIGKVPSKGTKSVPGEELERYSGDLRTYTGDTFSILGDTFTTFNYMSKGASSSSEERKICVWKLASEYQSIDGKFVVAYDTLGTSMEFTLSFYNVDQYGEETLIKSYTNACGDGAVDVHVNVTACDFVKVKLEPASYTGGATGIFYDITATTAE